MKDMYKLLQCFAQDSVLASNIDVTVTEHAISMKPKQGMDAYYNEACMLSDDIRGATNFLWWANRNNYEIKKKRGKK